MSKILVWFRNDLRLHDHEPLHRAIAKGGEVLPVCVIDERWLVETGLGFSRMGAFRAQFLLEAIADLRQQLQALGSDLWVRVGKPEDEVAALAEAWGATAVYASAEVCAEETKIEQTLEHKLWRQGSELQLYWTATLLHPEDLPFRIQNLPDIFTQFRKAVEAQARVRATFPSIKSLSKPSITAAAGDIPTAAQLGLVEVNPDGRGVLDFRGGEAAALIRLRHYIWEQDALRSYKETRNGLLGADYSSKFSPWLALGCLSPRTVYEAVKDYEAQRVKNESTYWLVFELLWRDYFRFVAKKYGNKIFQLQGIKNASQLTLKQHHKTFRRWVEGKTGIDFVDANMRELAATGFMSNRGRQNVASFLVKDLHIDWRWGAQYFESQLIDYDVCSNWGNWTYVAGVGNDPRENRYFNIPSQAKRYDPQGAYIHHWLGT